MTATFASKYRPGKLPGYGRPVNYVPQEGAEDFVGSLLPHALVYNARHFHQLTTLREFAMMQWMNEICSKPSWHLKVHNPEITHKWKEETLRAHAPNAFSEAMVDYCIAELQDRAKEVIDFQNPPPVLVFDAGVYRSDTAISREFKKEIQDAVLDFESRIPERKKDWHPGSEDTVWDLVHPSLFPLVYGKSRVLPNGETTTLDDCIERCGKGDIVPKPFDEELILNVPKHFYNLWAAPWNSTFFSRRFQWLPCEVDITGPEPKITSYINNLHPVHEKKLYRIVERVIGATIPLWELTIARIDRESFEPKFRINCDRAVWNRECTYETDEEDGGEGGKGDDDSDRDDEERIRPPPRVLIYPEPEPYTPRPVPESLSFRAKYRKQGLQVIVKLANIQLTPEQPSYAGGTWHVEGQLNERIVSTALYYYDNENITQSSVSFRQQVEPYKSVIDFGYEQYDYHWLEGYFGCKHEGPANQVIGHVKTEEGRLLTFPNTLQHRVGPFELADPTKPGHRKIIALFLVDPNTKIISSANVPCQQKEWRWDLLNVEGWELGRRATPNKPVGLDNLSAELREVVYRELDDFSWSLEMAKELRLELMEERSALVDGQNDLFESETFSLCEH